MANFTVTPWEVKGKVDYDKLIEKFGIQPLTQELLERLKKHTGELHLLLRRGVFFAHRDLDLLLDSYEKGEEFYLYTGRGPSGHTHIGHLIPWILTKWLQEKFNVELLFQVTDDEKFLFNQPLTIEEVRKYAYENILDIIAIGFKPGKTKIFLDTEYIDKLYPLAIQAAKKITFSTAKAVFGFTDSSNIGMIFFTSIQAAPAFLGSIMRGKPTRCLIPLAVDQDPHFRVARDVAPKLGFPKPSILHAKFFPSLLGADKMSSSDPQSAIYTVDSDSEVRRKIMNAFTGGQPTVKEQREKGGNPDICPIYQYCMYLFEPDDHKLKEVYYACKSGKLLCGEHKQILAEKVIKFLKEHRKRREKAKDMLEDFIVRD